MRMITVMVSDEFHSWLEGMVGHSLAMNGPAYMVDCVDKDQDGQLRCQGIFKAGMQTDGGPMVRDTIRRQDEDFAKRTHMILREEG